ncbi:MAG: hypothetical protein HZA54_07050 [Planctomycetes bacterium]|nr:hypothetical protein [Planctomycetota bacterium]
MPSRRACRRRIARAVAAVNAVRAAECRSSTVPAAPLEVLASVALVVRTRTRTPWAFGFGYE